METHVLFANLAHALTMKMYNLQLAGIIKDYSLYVNTSKNLYGSGYCSLSASYSPLEGEEKHLEFNSISPERDDARPYCQEMVDEFNTSLDDELEAYRKEADKHLKEAERLKKEAEEKYNIIRSVCKPEQA